MLMLTLIYIKWWFLVWLFKRNPRWHWGVTPIAISNAGTWLPAPQAPAIVAIYPTMAFIAKPTSSPLLTCHPYHHSSPSTSISDCTAASPAPIDPAPCYAYGLYTISKSSLSIDGLRALAQHIRVQQQPPRRLDGVNRRNLKIINFEQTLHPRLGLEINNSEFGVWKIVLLAMSFSINADNFRS
jgi:hypothetical protein